MVDRTEQPVYRIRRFYRKGDRPKKYAGTFEITDDRTGQVLAHCDLIGKAVFATLEIVDHRQEIWQMRPDRKIMPSRWIVSDPRQHVAMQFDQKIAGKVLNPLYRVVFALQDDKRQEAYRLADPPTGILDRIFGITPGEWALMHGDSAVAKLTRLPKRIRPAGGLFGKLKNMLAGSDRGIISAGHDHVLTAPIALVMVMLFEELTDVSGG